MNRTTCGAAGELLQSAGGRQRRSMGENPMDWTSSHCSRGLRPPSTERGISTQTKLGLGLLELEAGALIAIAPHCPRWASRRADAITVQIDRALGREVVL